MNKNLLLTLSLLAIAWSGFHTAAAQELDLSQAREIRSSGGNGSSATRRDKGMPMSFEMEALIIDLMAQNVDGDYCTIYKDKGVQVADSSVREWVDHVTFDATGIKESNIQKKKDEAGNEYLDVEISYSKEWDSRNNRVVGYQQPYRHVIFAYLELDSEDVVISQRDRLTSCVVEVMSSTAESGLALHSEFQQNQQQFYSRAGTFSQINQVTGMPDRTGQIINPNMMRNGAANSGGIATTRDPMDEIRDQAFNAMLGGHQEEISPEECAALRASMGEDACDQETGLSSRVQQIRSMPSEMLNSGMGMVRSGLNSVFGIFE